MKQPINQAIQDALTEIMSPNMQQQWAAAAMRPGIALVRAVLDLIEQQIGSAAPAQIPAKRGRKTKDAAAPTIARRSTGWPEDPEERRLEMIRRQQKAIENNGGKPIHPKYPGHPEHAKWKAKMSKLAKARLSAKGSLAAKIPRARIVNGAEQVA